MIAVGCSCGGHGDHSVARRKTSDGIIVVMWSDGAITGALGRGLPGVPIARPRSAKGRAMSIQAAWLFMGEVELYDLADVGPLYAACRKVARLGGLPGDVRAQMRGLDQASPTPSWVVLSADRDGRPTERVWVLPRLRWPGLAVWDTCGSARGRYEIVAEVARGAGTYQTTGMRFRRLAQLFRHLESI